MITHSQEESREIMEEQERANNLQEFKRRAVGLGGFVFRKNAVIGLEEAARALHDTRVVSSVELGRKLIRDGECIDYMTHGFMSTLRLEIIPGERGQDKCKITYRFGTDYWAPN